MLVLRIPTRPCDFARLLSRLKRGVTQPYWLCRLRDERFNAKHRIHTVQPPRKLWEIVVPWHTRGDMRFRFPKPVTFWGSLIEACGRVSQRLISRND